MKPKIYSESGDEILDPFSIISESIKQQSILATEFFKIQLLDGDDTTPPPRGKIKYKPNYLNGIVEEEVRLKNIRDLYEILRAINKGFKKEGGNFLSNYYSEYLNQINGGSSPSTGEPWKNHEFLTWRNISL